MAGVFGCRPEQISSPGWTLHAPQGVLGVVGGAATAGCQCGRRRLGARAMDMLDEFGSKVLAAQGYGYGPAFSGVCRPCGGEGAECSPTSLPEVCRYREFGIHPAVLDAALHA